MKVSVDITKKDYRAWAGMGQAYRVLGMYNYSLYYYERASALRYVFLSMKPVARDTISSGRPNDVTIWDGLGSCYEDTERYNSRYFFCILALTHWYPQNPGSHLRLQPRTQNRHQPVPPGHKLETRLNISFHGRLACGRAAFPDSGSDWRGS